MAIFTYFEDPAYVKEIFLLPLHNTGGIIVVKEDLIYVSVDDQIRKRENICTKKQTYCNFQPGFCHALMIQDMAFIEPSPSISTPSIFVGYQNTVES